MGTRNFGGSLLASHGPDTHVVQAGRHGQLQVRPLFDIEEHGLFCTRTLALEDAPFPQNWLLLAMHPNGYSCKELADRILKAWEDPAGIDRAMAQFAYILACGGVGRREETIRRVIAGEF